MGIITAFNNSYKLFSWIRHSAYKFRRSKVICCKKKLNNINAKNNVNLIQKSHFLLDQDNQIVFCGYGNVRDQLANNHQNLNEFNPTNLKRMDLMYKY